MTQDDLVNTKNRVKTNFKMQFDCAKKIFCQIEKQNWLKMHQITQDDLLKKNMVRTDFKMQFEASKKNFF